MPVNQGFFEIIKRFYRKIYVKPIHLSVIILPLQNKKTSFDYPVFQGAQDAILIRKSAGG